MKSIIIISISELGAILLKFTNKIAPICECNYARTPGAFHQQPGVNLLPAPTYFEPNNVISAYFANKVFVENCLFCRVCRYAIFCNFTGSVSKESESDHPGLLSLSASSSLSDYKSLSYMTLQIHKSLL